MVAAISFVNPLRDKVRSPLNQRIGCYLHKRQRECASTKNLPQIATLHPVQHAQTRTASREIGSAYDNGASSAFIYNYFRDYDPSIGRYVESDPIGLKGGRNTFGYVGQSPLSGYDPRGLEIVPGGPSDGPGIPLVEICVRPPSLVQPVPHGFLCVDGDCSGFYPRPGANPVWPNPGEWRDDTGQRSRSVCTTTPPPNGCGSYFANCIANCTKPGPRPYPYSIGGLTCLDRADTCLQTCKLACGGRKQ